MFEPLQCPPSASSHKGRIWGRATATENRAPSKNSQNSQECWTNRNPSCWRKKSRLKRTRGRNSDDGARGRDASRWLGARKQVR